MKPGTLPRVAASQSFTAEEVVALDQLVTLVLRGGDTRVCGKNAAFPNIARKVAAMKGVIARAKAARADPNRTTIAKEPSGAHIITTGDTDPRFED